MSTLYRKYRPQAWNEVAAQNHVKTTLAFQVAMGRTAHAYLFAGPRGVGKTTTARILAKALNCTTRAKLQAGDPAKGDPCGECDSCVAIAENRALDVIEMDAASNRGIDNVREHIVAGSRFTPSSSAYKVFIIDEVHMLTTEAFNALLKTLEEPPAHAIFILATTETHKVPPTILSRCQRFDFRKIPFGEMVDRLHKVAEREGVKVDKRAIEEVARAGEGCLRDAESLLGKVLAMGDGKRVTYDEAVVALPRTDAVAVNAMVDALLHRDARGALVALHNAVDDGVDAEELADGLIESLRTILVAKLGGGPDAVAFDADEEEKKRITDNAALAAVPELVVALETVMAKRRDMKTARPAHLPLEIALVRICAQMGVPVIPAPPVRSSEASIGQAGIQTSAPTAHRPAAEYKSTPTPPPVTPAQRPTPKSEEPPPVMATPDVIRGKQSHEDVRFEETLTVTETVTETTAEVVVEHSVTVQAAPTASVHTEAPAFSVDKLAASWTDFMSRAGEINAGMPFLLAAGKPIEVEGKIVRIGFEYGFHKEKMNQEKNRRILEGVLLAMFGKEVRVEGVVLEKSGDFGHTDFASVQTAPMAPAKAASDGNVMTAFGGRVVG